MAGYFSSSLSAFSTAKATAGRRTCPVCLPNCWAYARPSSQLSATSGRQMGAPRHGLLHFCFVLRTVAVPEGFNCGVGTRQHCSNSSRAMLAFDESTCNLLSLCDDGWMGEWVGGRTVGRSSPVHAHQSPLHHHNISPHISVINLESSGCGDSQFCCCPHSFVGAPPI